MQKVFGRYLKGGEHHARFIAKEQKHEAELGRKMSYWERHSFALDFFDLIAKSIEDLRYERSQMFKQPADGGRKVNAADADANAAGTEPKRKRKRGGRGAGTTTTTTTTKKAAAAKESNSPEKKAVKKEATDTAPGAGVNVTVNFTNPKGGGKKGGKKGAKKGGDKGKGKGKSKAKGKGKGKGGGFDFKKPNPVQPMSWSKDNGDWKCTHPNCGWFNWQRNDKCQWCQSKKGYQHTK